MLILDFKFKKLIKIKLTNSIQNAVSIILQKKRIFFKMFFNINIKNHIKFFKKNIKLIFVYS